MAHHETIRPRVKAAIARALRLAVPPDEIPDDEVLFGEGPDSVLALELVVALEDEFGFEVDDDELGSELFDSVNGLTAYVARKERERGSTGGGLHGDEADR